MNDQENPETEIEIVVLVDGIECEKNPAPLPRNVKKIIISTGSPLSGREFEIFACFENEEEKEAAKGKHFDHHLNDFMSGINEVKSMTPDQQMQKLRDMVKTDPEDEFEDKDELLIEGVDVINKQIIVIDQLTAKIEGLNVILNNRCQAIESLHDSVELKTKEIEGLKASNDCLQRMLEVAEKDQANAQETIMSQNVNLKTRSDQLQACHKMLDANTETIDMLRRENSSILNKLNKLKNFVYSIDE